MDPEAYSWFMHRIRLQHVMVIPPAHSTYVPQTWPLFKYTFRHHFVPEVAISAVRKAICMLRNSIKQFSKHIQMVLNDTNITCKDPLYEKDGSKVALGIADQIITPACMQKELQPETPFTLTNTIGMVGEFSKGKTLHPAIMAMRTSFSPSNTTTGQISTSSEPMDLTLANANTKRYHCRGFRHKACDCANPDMGG
jgi:hypothetical protein